jgi:hypothetical protein
MTPCYYCEEDADVACRACIHSSTGPEIEQVIAWRAAPPPAADAVSDDDIVARAMKHCDATVDHRGRVEYAFDKHGLIAFVRDITVAAMDTK